MLILALAMMLMQGVPAQAAAPVAVTVPVEDPAVTALARKIYMQMRAGKVDAELVSPEMQAGLSPEKLAGVKPMFDQLGDPTKLTLDKREVIGTGVRWEYTADFATARLHVQIYVDAAGKVAGYFVTP